MTREEAVAALQKARRATEKAKEKVREAESHLQLMKDAEREAWVAVQDAIQAERHEVDINWKLVKVRGE